MFIDDHPVEADVASVCSLMAGLRIEPERQAALWLDLWRQWPHPDWGEKCVEQAERAQSILDRSRALAAGASAAGQPAGQAGDDIPQRRHFWWQGERRGVLAAQLRDCIQTLAQLGMIANDAGQQNALRRGLGLFCNEAERHEEAPWVVWLGDADMLWLFVSGLWDLKLISCADGERMRWVTLRGVFRPAGGGYYGRNFRNTRCTNPDKQQLMEQKIFSPLRFLCGGKYGG